MLGRRRGRRFESLCILARKHVLHLRPRYNDFMQVRASSDCYAVMRKFVLPTRIVEEVSPALPLPPPPRLSAQFIHGRNLHLKNWENWPSNWPVFVRQLVKFSKVEESIVRILIRYIYVPFLSRSMHIFENCD